MIGLWIGFIALIVGLLVLDLTVIHRDSKAVTTRSALAWVTFFVAAALAFNAAVYFAYDRDWFGLGASYREHQRHFEAAQEVMAGRLRPDEVATWVPPPDSPAARAMEETGARAAARFLAGWITEYSLSIDNIFIIAVIFTHFRVPALYQRRVLFWGILGALVMRGVMIGAGTALLERFHWLLYVFGAFLIFTAIKLLFARPDEDVDFEKRRIVRWTRRVIAVSPDYDGDKFFTRMAGGGIAATPLLLVLLIIEFTDLIFALDSIPAILGITTDPFLVFTSNVFAVLGLRSLFFALSGMLSFFHYLKYSLAAILGFVGIKMVVTIPLLDIRISTTTSLMFIAAALFAGVAASLVRARRLKRTAPNAPEAARQS